MILKHKLLEHPFYQAWEKGEITKQQLSNYAKSYNEFITHIPVFWETVINAFDSESPLGKKVIEEEISHISLWNKWAEKLSVSDSYPSLNNEIDAFKKMNASELLGAIHSFEIQQPEVAKTKKAGLLNHYGFSEKETLYFDEHMNEQEHIKYGEFLYKNFANKEDFERGFNEGAKLIYHSLDKY